MSVRVGIGGEVVTTGPRRSDDQADVRRWEGWVLSELRGAGAYEVAIYEMGGADETEPEDWTCRVDLHVVVGGGWRPGPSGKPKLYEPLTKSQTVVGRGLTPGAAALDAVSSAAALVLTASAKVDELGGP